MSKLRILVTGGHGFLGSRIVKALQEQLPDSSITVLDVQGRTTKDDKDHQTKFVLADITIPESVKQAFQTARPDVVIHTAGFSPPLSERYLRRIEHHVMNVNVNGTRNLLQAATEFQCQAFVYTSSCTAVTDDLANPYPNIDETWPVSRKSSMYGESKVAAEELVLAANSNQMATCVLRPAVIFGEGDYALIPAMYTLIEKNQTYFRLGNGLNLWDVVYVGNAADAHVLALQNLLSTRTAAGEAFFIQNNEPISFRELCLAVWKEFDHYPPFEIPIPQNLGVIFGWLTEWVTWFTATETTFSRGSFRDACAVRYASGEKARQVLGYNPRVSLEEGIRRSCKDFLFPQHQS